MKLFLTAGQSLEERLTSGESVICAEGYLLALARRGYISHGVFIPDVVLENPEMVKLLHYEFAHCGSDVMEAFQVINTRRCEHHVQAISKRYVASLAWPDSLRTGAYRLEIISAVLQESGVVHSVQAI